MDNHDEFFEKILETMHDEAAQALQQTQMHRHFQEKLANISEDCESMLADCEQGFVNDCFGELFAMEAECEAFFYRRGLRDAVRLLKRFGVLA